MYCIIVENAVIDFIGINDQVMLPGQFDNFLQNRLGVNSPGGIVGIDYHNAPGIRCDLAGDILDVRLPFVGFVAEIVNRLAPGQIDGSCPQGVIRHRHQNFVTVVEQRLHGHDNQLADAVAQEDIVDVDIRDANQLATLHDGLAGTVDAFGVAVALGLGQVVNDVVNDLVGRFKTERGGVANIQLQDAQAFFLKPVGVVEHRAANIVADVIQLV